MSKLLFKHNTIPILVELRTVDFQSIGVTNTHRDDREEEIRKTGIEKHVVKELGFEDKPLHRDLVRALLSEGKISLVLDGFDEIVSSDQQDAANEIQRMAREYNKTSFVVTSRPQGTLPQLGKMLVLEFDDLSHKQVESLLLRYDQFVSADFGKRLLSEIGKVPAVFLENPLTISLLYRTFAINGTVADRVSEFYSELYIALFHGHDIRSKDNYVREKRSKLDIVAFRQALRAFSYTVIVKDEYFLGRRENAISLVTESAGLISDLQFDGSDFFHDLTHAVPIVLAEGTDFKFLHKTVAEYFAAEYVVHNKRREEIMAKILKAESSARMFGVK